MQTSLLFVVHFLWSADNSPSFHPARDRKKVKWLELFLIPRFCRRNHLLSTTLPTEPRLFSYLFSIPEHEKVASRQFHKRPENCSLRLQANNHVSTIVRFETCFRRRKSAPYAPKYDSGGEQAKHAIVQSFSLFSLKSSSLYSVTHLTSSPSNQLFSPLDGVEVEEEESFFFYTRSLAF